MLYENRLTGEKKDWAFSEWFDYITNPNKSESYECSLSDFIERTNKFREEWVETYEDREVVDLTPNWEKIQRQVDSLNKLIDEAIIHGGDGGGAYLTNRERLEEAINDYLDVTGLKALVDVYWKDEDDPLLILNDGRCRCPGCVRNYKEALDD